MKICFITDISEKDVFGLDFVNYFSKDNDVEVITFFDYNPKLIPSSVKVYRLLNPINYNYPEKKVYLKQFLKLVELSKNILAETKPDMVISLNMDGHSLLSALSGFHPFIWFSYGSDISYGMYLSFYNKQKGKYILSKADMIFVQDKLMYDRLRQLRVRPKKIIVRHWGVDIDFYHMNESKEKLYDVVNIHGYNTTYYRYVDVYLEALSILRNRGIKLKAVLIGNKGMIGNTGFYNKIIDNLGLTDILIQKEFLSSVELRDMFWKTRIMVDPMYPQYHDGCGYGIGLIQAMASGLPLICADRKCTVMSDEDKWFYGLVFRHCDADDLADKIELLLGDKVRQDNISKYNRLSVEKCFDRDKNMEYIEWAIKYGVMTK
jgi:glycosyltransferase involved in cell wall biosynthesis